MFFSKDLVGEELDRISDDTFFIDKNFLKLSPLWFPLPANLRFRRAVHHLREMIGSILRERATSKDHANDLISTLFTAEGGWNEEEMINEIFSIHFGAGVQSTTLAWCLYLVATNPGLQERLKQEADRVFPGRLPTAADFDALSYARQVLDETLRIFPPSRGYPRWCGQDAEIAGYHIPADSMVIPMIYHTHRHPGFWDDPELFNPERFAKGLPENRHPFAHLPYGAGPRICLGAQLAPMVMAPIVAMICQRYRFEFQPHSPSDPVADFGFEIHPSNEIRVAIRKDNA